MLLNIHTALSSKEMMKKYEEALRCMAGVRFGGGEALARGAACGGGDHGLCHPGDEDV